MIRTMLIHSAKYREMRLIKDQGGEIGYGVKIHKSIHIKFRNLNLLTYFR